MSIAYLSFLITSVLLFALPLVSASESNQSAQNKQTKQTRAPLSSRIQPGQDSVWENFSDKVFRHLSSEQGLPQYSATAIAQDAEGFVWVGTQGGLARWDGYRFRNYLPINGDQNSLPDNYVMSLYTDSLGRLWIGTNGGGLARYDAVFDRFIRVPFNSGGTGSTVGTSHVTINSIAGDGKNGLWLSTRAGVNHYDPDTGAFEYYRAKIDDHNSLPSDFSRAILQAKNGVTWVGTSKGLSKLDRATKRFEIVPLPATSKIPRVVSLLETSDGKIWVGTFESGAFYIEPNDPNPKRLLIHNAQKNQNEIANDNVFVMRQMGDNEVWLGSYGKGIVSVNMSTLQTKRLTHEPDRSSSLIDNSVWSLLRDRAGLIWVGTQRGVSVHDPNAGEFISLFGGENRNHGLTGIDFFSSYGFADGSVWIGSQNHGISMLSPNGDRFKLIPADDTRPQTALPQSAVFTIYPTDDQHVFIGTDKGLYLTDKEAKNLRRINLFPRGPNMRVAALLQYENQLLIGGTEGMWVKDLAHLDNDIASQPEWVKPLASKFITDIQMAPDGAIWISTLQDGLFRYDIQASTWRNYMPGIDNKEGLAHRNIANIVFDTRGWLWIAMQGGGVDLLREPHGQEKAHFEHFRKASGLPNDLVNKVLEDKQNNMWVSTDEGLARILVPSMAVTPFSSSDGVAITGYWSNAGGSTANGELIFGGVGGITVVRPELVKEYVYRPPIVVTSIELGGKALAANHLSFVGDKAHALTIQPEANSVMVEFAALDFSASEHNRYAYKLDGYDKDWVETDASRRLAAYTNLPPGDYVLHLRGSNRNGAWTEPHLQLSVKVLPAWYQTWWANLLYGVGIISLMLLLVRWRLWRLRTRNKTLEQQVQERTKELEISRKMLEEQSLTDYLTGLRNRRYLNLCIEDDVAQTIRSYRQLAPDGLSRVEHGAVDPRQQQIDLVFIMVDLDHFKSVNDEFGHAAGDAVLKQTTEILLNVVRERDSVIRWGGEEFLIVMRHANHSDAEQLAERIRQRIGQHAFTLPNGAVLHRTCSIGMACYPFVPSAIETFTWEQVIDIADQCLYAAKHGGRDAWVGLFLLGSHYHHGQFSHIALEIAQQVAQGRIAVKTSLPASTSLDWSHGRQK